MHAIVGNMSFATKQHFKGSIYLLWCWSSSLPLSYHQATTSTVLGQSAIVCKETQILQEWTSFGLLRTTCSASLRSLTLESERSPESRHGTSSLLLRHQPFQTVFRQWGSMVGGPYFMGQRWDTIRDLLHFCVQVQGLVLLANLSPCRKQGLETTDLMSQFYFSTQSCLLVVLLLFTKESQRQPSTPFLKKKSMLRNNRGLNRQAKFMQLAFEV